MSDTHRFGFLLLPDFAMMAFSAAVEPLRAANRISRRALYRWSFLSADGAPVAASNGLPVVVDRGLDHGEDFDTVLVCAGLDAHAYADDRVFGWLRARARCGCRIGALSTGTYILARAGLLGNRRCTIHWEAEDAFVESFPGIRLSGDLFEIDGDRMTCCGGTAALDMMLYLIGADHGDALAAEVSDQFIHERIRNADDRHRRQRLARIAARSPRLHSAIELMEANTEEPLGVEALAAGIGASKRQLERLFRRHVGCTPGRFYMSLRLEKARLLLLQTDMSVTNVGLASGFVAVSHFSRAYRGHYGRTPRQERAFLSG